MSYLPPSAGAYLSQTFFCHLWRSIVIPVLSVASDSCNKTQKSFSNCKYMAYIAPKLIISMEIAIYTYYHTI